MLAFVDDALACNGLAVFKQSFSPNGYRGFRTCFTPTSEFPDVSYNTQCATRTENEIDDQVLRLRGADSEIERRSLSKVYGIKDPSVLRQLPYFMLSKDLLSLWMCS